VGKKYETNYSIGVFFDILSYYTIGNIIFCIFKFNNYHFYHIISFFVFLNLIIITARVYKLRLADLHCYYLFNFLQLLHAAPVEQVKE